MQLLPLFFQAFMSTAEAGKCDEYVNQAANQEGAALVRTFASLARCDKSMAEDNFLNAFSSKGERSEYSLSFRSCNYR